MTQSSPTIHAVAIGRNEGQRLIACLESLQGQTERIVYVDSGSNDGSVAAAKDRGVDVVALNMDSPFTAARARNAGIAALAEGSPPDFVQFIDGDCVLDPAWLDAASAFLQENPDVAVVCGRRRERFPEKTVYNRMCDAEWDTPIGEASACGGDALMRWDALQAVDGYNPGLIAGEEPEMCLRMRRLGWKIWRLDAEMTLHDADMSRFGQFWKRASRAGHAAAEGQAMHGRGPEKHGVAATRRALLWGIAIPLVVICLIVLVGPLALWLLLVYPLQVVRLALRDGNSRFAWEQAILLTLGKFAESQGILTYYWRRWRGHQAQLIEYK
ncbi:glycosyltransferase [Cognatiyoonia sp. IB215182]|uniref:glycosyltransferase n=1 Tax=Cognatiyoonia sp. IB215182 TaxID=3097353 RepID=UPI002A0C8CCB|nr:glycosyltransferase [Cognatiyoonia sp. IB215182]MDX8353103.1 glycosyltransferase [Cognatiyoonia sp. IB215182]